MPDLCRDRDGANGASGCGETFPGIRRVHDGHQKKRSLHRRQSADTCADTAITVSVRNGKVSTTDGPFAETKEQLGGYYVIEAKDLNEAIQVAANIPGARFGCVEVRPIAEDPQTLALGLNNPGVV
jgi:hypothetical protein